MEGSYQDPWNRHSPAGTIVLQGAIIAVAASGILIYCQYVKSSISTSQAAVGSVVGSVFLWSLKNKCRLYRYIISWWIITPILAWLLAYLMGKYLYTHILIWLADHHESDASIRKSLNILLTISGCYVAYSAGANKCCKCSRSFVGAGIIGSIPGAISQVLLLVLAHAHGRESP